MKKNFGTILKTMVPSKWLNELKQQKKGNKGFKL